MEAGINKIEPAQWRKIDDFIPFLSLPLEKIEKTNFDNNKNLIYEISEKYSVSEKLLNESSIFFNIFVLNFLADSI